MGSSANTTKECTDYVCVDLETSGGDIHTAEIIEIGAVKVVNGEIIDKYSTLVKPNNPVNPYTYCINGISDNDVINAPSIEEVFDSFLEFVGDSILLGHNIAAFDLQILRGAGFQLKKYIKNQYLDTLYVAKKILPDLPSYSLTSLCEYYGIENAQAHRALSDCLANIEVYNAMMKEKEGNSKNISRHKKAKNYYVPVSDTTKLLIRLMGIVEGIICDGNIDEKEIKYLRNWLNDHTNLKGNYQYDAVVQALDGKKDITTTLASIVNPIENKTETTISDIELNGKLVCITGEFDYGSRSDVEQRLIKTGAEISPSVVKAVDYLIVGGRGSESWACGNYGTKVKRALELQEKGAKIKIIKESEVLKYIWNKSHSEK